MILLLAAGLCAGTASSLLAQAERVKSKARDLKKQVEGGTTTKTNAPGHKPGK